MIWLWILLGIIAAVALFEGAIVVVLLYAADAENHDPATVDLEDAPVYAIDSAGKAYEAVAVKDCDTCGQALPTDHRCTAGAA